MAVPDNAIFGAPINRCSASFASISGSEESADYHISNLRTTDIGKTWRQLGVSPVYSGFLWISKGIDDIGRPVPSAFPMQCFALIAHNLGEGSLWRVHGSSNSVAPASSIVTAAPNGIAASSNVTDDGGSPVASITDVDESPDSSSGDAHHKFTSSGSVRYDFGAPSPSPDTDGDVCGFVVSYRGASAATSVDAEFQLWDGNGTDSLVRSLGGCSLSGTDSDVTRRHVYYFDRTELTDTNLSNAQLHVISTAGFWIDAVQLFGTYSGSPTAFDSGILSVYDTFSELAIGSPTLNDIASDGINFVARYVHASEVTCGAFRVTIWNKDPDRETSGFKKINSDTPVEVGHALAGAILSPPYNMEYGMTDIVEDTSDIIEMDDGGTLANRKARKRVVTVTIPDMTNVYAKQNFKLWFDLHIGKSRPFLFIPRPNEVGSQTMDTIFGRMAEIGPFTANHFNSVSKQYTIKEW